MHPQSMADQTRGRGIKDAAQDEAAARCDRDDFILVVGCAPHRQPDELGPLHLQALSDVGVAPADDLIDEAAVSFELAHKRSASSSARLRWPWALSIEQFSWATPRLLRVGVMS
jgi:hypothetical protein